MRNLEGKPHTKSSEKNTVVLNFLANNGCDILVKNFKLATYKTQKNCYTGHILYGSSLAGDQRQHKKAKGEDSKNLVSCFSRKGCHGENSDKMEEKLCFYRKKQAEKK